MHIFTLISMLIPIVDSTSVQSPQHVFSNPPSPNEFNIPTSRESAVMARRILHLTPSGTLSTVFPFPGSDSAPQTLERRPSGLAGIPIGLMDYIADCESGGDPTILAINIATSFKNVADGSNISLSLQWTPPYLPSSRIELRDLGMESETRTLFSAANLPRFSLLGYLEKIGDDAVEASDLSTCFTKVHPDAKYWLPGSSIHRSEWTRLVVQDIYWIGGFGDRAYIGWIPVEEWRSVTMEEWEGIRLPGEKKGWKEWAVESWVHKGL